MVWKNLAELGVRRENNVNVLWMTHIPPLKKLLNLFLSIDIFKESQYTLVKVFGICDCICPGEYR